MAGRGGLFATVLTLAISLGSAQCTWRSGCCKRHPSMDSCKARIRKVHSPSDTVVSGDKAKSNPPDADVAPRATHDVNQTRVARDCTFRNGCCQRHPSMFVCKQLEDLSLTKSCVSIRAEPRRKSKKVATLYSHHETKFRQLILALLDGDAIPQGSLVDAGAHTGEEACFYSQVCSLDELKALLGTTSRFHADSIPSSLAACADPPRARARPHAGERAVHSIALSLDAPGSAAGGGAGREERQALAARERGGTPDAALRGAAPRRRSTAAFRGGDASRHTAGHQTPLPAARLRSGSRFRRMTRTAPSRRARSIGR